jgi:hypothetical protein
VGGGISFASIAPENFGVKGEEAATENFFVKIVRRFMAA